MPFLDHLEELRWHLIRSGIAIVVFSILAFSFKDLLFDQIIFAPSSADFWTYRQLCALGEILSTDIMCLDSLNISFQNTWVAGQFMAHLQYSFIVGLILGFPYTFWELWRFIKPGLEQKERTNTRGVTFFVTLLFTIGILFGYFFVFPISLNFFLNYTVSSEGLVPNNYFLTSYVGFLSSLVLSCGILFQLPMLVYILTKIGLITDHFLRTYYKQALVSILIISAIFTPSDVLTMFMMAIPLIILYQISIYIAKFTVARNTENE